MYCNKYKQVWASIDTQRYDWYHKTSICCVCHLVPGLCCCFVPYGKRTPVPRIRGYENYQKRRNALEYVLLCSVVPNCKTNNTCTVLYVSTNIFVINLFY